MYFVTCTQLLTAAPVNLTLELTMISFMKPMDLWTGIKDVFILGRQESTRQECVMKFFPRVSVLSLLVEKIVRVAPDRMDLIAQQILMIYDAFVAKDVLIHARTLAVKPLTLILVVSHQEVLQGHVSPIIAVLVLVVTAVLAMMVVIVNAQIVMQA